ncbi:hypothetical protein JXA80_00080 [bacterium]|nr:hypothetical protein [candidate division CSSED10-310 bacterium]
MRKQMILSRCLIVAVIIILGIGCESGDDITGLSPTIADGLDIAGPGQGAEADGDRGFERAAMRDSGMGGHNADALITKESGGTLVFWNGRLTVLPGSIDETKVVTARTYSLQRHDFFKKIYEFGPSGTTFDPDAELVLTYCDLGPLVPDTLVLRVFNEQTQEWEPAGHMTNHPSTRTFSGPISHFSRYSLSGNGQVLRPQVQ